MRTQLRFLLVEDSESDAHLIARHISKAGIEGSIRRVETEDELIDALRQSKPDVILCDFSLPKLSGLRALELAIAHAPNVPFIYVSGTIGEERAVDALRRGATDYILKSNLSRLTTSIERALRESLLRAEKQKSEQAQREQGIRLQRLTRTYQTLSSTSSAIVRLRSPSELMDEVCRIAVEQGGYDYVSISVLESDGQLRTPRASARSVNSSGPNDHDTVADLEMTRVLAQRAIGTAAPSVLDEAIITNDILDPAGQKYRAAAAMPLIVDGTAIGAMAFFSATANIFDEAEIKVLLELTANLGFALQYLAKDETVHFLSYFDSLTGLAKRLLFCQRLSTRISAAGTKLGRTVIVFDVQKLGAINDSLGRYVGDRLLEQIAARLKQAYLDSENIAYFGAGTFAVTLESQQSDAHTGRFQQHAAARLFAEPFALQGEAIRVAIRAGIACYPDDGESAERLVQNAETALNCARAENEKYKLYGLITSHSRSRNLALETRLSDALARNEFLLYYQPKTDIETGALEGFEALLRWQDSREGLVPPASFIPLLERSGAIIEVGEWVIQQAARDIREWYSHGLSPVRVAVNVSPSQLRQRDFVDRIVRTVDTVTEYASGLDIEITESMLMQDLQLAIRKLSLLREAHVGVAIDDFGTGYSSLCLLASLPVDTLKIDRTFIQRLLDTPNGKTVVSMIISLGRTFNMRTVAEGVESAEQLGVLRHLQCDQAQGFLLGRPTPASEVPAVIARLRSATRARAGIHSEPLQDSKIYSGTSKKQVAPR